MFCLNESHRFYLYTCATDMRKGFDALCGVVISQMGRDPLSGEVFIFANRAMTTIKLLHWERGGFVLYHKRLAGGRFSFPRYDSQKQSYSLAWHDLVLMIEGIRVDKVRYLKRYKKISQPA